MLLLLICVSLVNLIVSPVDGLIKIESQPAKVAYGSYVQLVCDVGTMINTVKWVSDGVTYYSCDPPYNNCFTNTSVTNDGIYFFSIKDNSLTMIFLLNQNTNDSTWSCYHGNDKADIDIDNADAPNKPSLTISGRPDYPDFECYIHSQKPADVVIYAQNYLGIRKLYEKNQTMITDHSIRTSLDCEDYRLFCSVSNGYGPPVISDYEYVDKDCPVKVLRYISYIRDLRIWTNSSWVFNEIGKMVEFRVYYVGSPTPSYSLHHYTTDGYQEVRKDANISLVLNRQRTVDKPRYVSVTFNNPKESDAGKYIVTLKQNTHVMVGFLVPLEYTGKSASSGGMVVGKTKAGTMIIVCMAYLGLSVYFGSIE